ncbi:MAG: small multi-drug export protein [Myxococcota bacterium]
MPHVHPDLPPRTRLALTATPILASLAFGGVLGLLWPWERVLALGGAAAAATVWAGKFVIVGPVTLEGAMPFTPWDLALMVAWMDVCVAALVVANFALLERIPWIGERLRHLEESGRRAVSRKRSLRKIAEVVVALFVMFPVAGTGAVGAAVLGRLFGLNVRRILLSVLAGTLVGCFTLAGAAHVLGAALAGVRHELWFKLTGTGVLVAVVAFLGWWGHRIGAGLTRHSDDDEPHG